MRGHVFCETSCAVGLGVGRVKAGKPPGGRHWSGPLWGLCPPGGREEPWRAACASCSPRGRVVHPGVAPGVLARRQWGRNQGTETQMSPMSWERTSLTEASPGPPPPQRNDGAPRGWGEHVLPQSTKLPSVTCLEETPLKCLGQWSCSAQLFRDLPCHGACLRVSAPWHPWPRQLHLPHGYFP